MRFFTICIVFALLSFPALAQCDTGEVKVRFGAFNQPQDQPRIRAVDRLRRAIDIEMNGKLCLEVVKDDEKFSGTSAIVALQNGEVDLIAPRYSALGQFIPAYRLYALPFAFRNADSVARFDTLTVSTFNALLVSRNLQPLSRWQGTAKQLLAKGPVYDPADIAGMRLQLDRTTGFGRFVSALRATQQNVADKDLVEAIKNQRITAVSADWAKAQSLRLASALNGVTETNHSFDGYHVMTSKDWWGKLDPALQKSFREIVARLARQSNFDTSARDSNAKKAIMRGGAPVRTLTRKQRMKWREAVADIWAGFESFQSGDALLRMLEPANKAF